MTATKPEIEIRDRIKELRRVKASDLLAHPRNPRLHPDHQAAALSGLLSTIGYADALLARETPEGLRLIDGHLRQKLTPDALVPVLVLDVDEDEANLLLASLDPLSALATYDRENLDALLHEVSTSDAAVQEMLAGLARENHLYETGSNDATEHWRDMPGCNQEDKLGVKTLFVHFATEDDMKAFADLVGQTVTKKTKYIWYPEQEQFPASEYAYTNES